MRPRLALRARSFGCHVNRPGIAGGSNS
jgi:hypothetical protein